VEEELVWFLKAQQHRRHTLSSLNIPCNNRAFGQSYHNINKHQLNQQHVLLSHAAVASAAHDGSACGCEVQN
jgi:hypothetical protein